MPKVVVAVTGRHLDAGERKNCNKCPIALAAAEALGVKAVYANADGICFTLVDDHDVYMADDLVDLMDNFDAGRTVSPFWYRLELPGAG